MWQSCFYFTQTWESFFSTNYINTSNKTKISQVIHSYFSFSFQINTSLYRLLLAFIKFIFAKRKKNIFTISFHHFSRKQAGFICFNLYNKIYIWMIWIFLFLKRSLEGLILYSNFYDIIKHLLQIKTSVKIFWTLQFILE